MLDEMDAYYFDRDEFCKAVEATIGIDRLLDAMADARFNGFDIIGSFAFWRYDDEFYIVDMRSGMMINWYKHLGRTNTCSQPGRTIYDLREFFARLARDIDEREEESK